VTEWSEQDADQHIEQRLREIEVLREAAQQQGLTFAALTEEELYRKVRGEESGEESSRSPYIYSWAYSYAPSSGGASGSCEFHIANPDPRSHFPLFVSIFFGVANFLDDIGEGLIGRDQRWPYLSKVFGLAAGATTKQDFNFTTPAFPPSTYIGNAVLWKGDPLGKGDYFDRALFWINTLSGPGP
jgi:hypothetical protein